MCPDSRFPVAEIEELSSLLEKMGYFIPGYQSPEVGLLNWESVIYEQCVDNLKFCIIPDRNIVTRIAAIARDGMPKKPDNVTSFSAKLMAYAQCLDINFEPAIAYHELASTQGNEKVYEELSWFRKADAGGQAKAWIDIAFGRRFHLDENNVTSEEKRDFTYPLYHWRHNYLAALKIANLELKKGI